MKRVAVLVALLALTACGQSLDERAEKRDKCESAGGRWHEYHDGWGYLYGECLLDPDGD